MSDIKHRSDAQLNSDLAFQLRMKNNASMRAQAIQEEIARREARAKLISLSFDERAGDTPKD